MDATADGIRQAEENMKSVQYRGRAMIANLTSVAEVRSGVRNETIADVRKEKVEEQIYDSNGKIWCHLPIELKSKMIKDMDINLRLSLRATAHQEREIVDSHEIHFSRVVFDNQQPFIIDNGTIYQIPKPGCNVLAEYSCRPIHGKKSSTKATSSSVMVPTVLDSAFIKKKELKMNNENTYFSAVYFLAYVLKVGKIDYFQIEETDSPDEFEKCLEVLAKSAPFHIKEFKVIAMKKPLVMFFMKHLAEGLETIRLDAEGSENFPFDEFLTFPVFFNAKYILIKSFKCTKAASKLAEQWIINDAAVDNIFNSPGCDGLKTMDEFVVKFVDRIVTKNENNVRIKTDNESKHILLRVIKNHMYCSIIPSTMEESEYEEINKKIPKPLHWEYREWEKPKSWDENVCNPTHDSIDAEKPAPVQ